MDGGSITINIHLFLGNTERILQLQHATFDAIAENVSTSNQLYRAQC